MTIKVVIADDHEVVRSGLTSLLKGSDIEVVAEAADGKEAVKAVEQHEPERAPTSWWRRYAARWPIRAPRPTASCRRSSGR